MLASHTILTFAALASLTHRCIGSEAPAAMIDALKLGALPPISPELKAQVIASLPKEGEVKTLNTVVRRKLGTLTPVLKVHGRDADYIFKVVESPQARVAIHARFVVLITDTALRLLTPSQLRAVVAHEIGHEYVWEKYDDARKRRDWRRLRELELFCDGVAVHTLVATGAPVSALGDALRNMIASDERNNLVTDTTKDSHPSLAERCRFIKEVAKRSQDRAVNAER